jgi:ribosome maturation factor RimP
MLTENIIQGIIADITAQSGLFVVGVTVKPGNKIIVLIDSLKGVTIDECAMLSRTIEQQLDRDKEDFDLEISSPGLTQPFKVIQQYHKNIGKQVEVIRKDGEKFYGMLLSAGDNTFVVQTKEKRILEGKKKAEEVIEQVTIALEEVKSTKVVINF